MAQNKSDVSKVAVAGVAGAVIGGAVVAATTILSDDKNRKKVGKAVTGIKDQAMEHLHSQEVQDKAEDLVDKISDKKSDTEKKVSGK